MNDGFRLQGDSEISPLSSLDAMLGLGLEKEEEDDASLHQRAEEAGDLIGVYRLLSLLGEGGFGTVWRAQQIEPVQRELALKLIKAGMSSRAILARFEAERQALAMMEHPNIAAVLDAGTTRDGRSYFAMELVEGPPLTIYCDERRLTVRARVELFLSVCLAVQHAHQKGIIHRDLKPSNILVMERDGKPVPKVIDFGVAKALGVTDLPAFQASVLYTQIGAVIGTLQYMSPEQAGSAEDVDTRSDIYTLGVILYELLTGSTPQGQTLSVQQPFDEALRAVREGAISTPSSHHFIDKTELSQKAGLRNLAPASFRKYLRGDLDWITLKALDKDRGRRYATAAALAEDLQRYLDGRPVTAVAPSWRYQLARFARRNRLGIATASIVVIALVSGTGVSLWQAAEAKMARTAAEASRVLAEKKSKEAEENLARARSAVETYLSTVTDDPKLNSDDFSDLRQRLLSSALPIYEEMLRGSAEPALRGERGEALRRLAGLYQSQGDFPKAEEIFRRAIAEFEELFRADPKNAPYGRSLRQSYNDLGASLKETGELEESARMLKKAAEIATIVFSNTSEDADCHQLSTVLTNQGVSLECLARYPEADNLYRQALEFEAPLTERNPKENTYTALVAICHANRARTLFLQKRHSESAEEDKQAISIQEELMRLEPDNLGHPAFLSLSYYGLGLDLQATGEPGQALNHFHHALALEMLLTNRFPHDPVYRGTVAKCHYSMAGALYDLKWTEEALKEYVVFQNMVYDLMKEFPSVPEFQHLLGMGMQNEAGIFTEGERWDEAQAAFLESIRGYRMALDSQPGDETILEETRNAYQGMIEMLVKAGREEAAASALPEAVALLPDHWQQYEFAARMLAQCVAAKKDDAALADRWREQAVDYLKKAIANGCPEIAKLHDSTDFEALRGNAGFEELTRKEK